MNWGIPSLPTDNLYKFMAITGFAMTFISLVLPIISLNKTAKDLGVLRAQNDAIARDLKLLDASIQADLANKDKQMMENYYEDYMNLKKKQNERDRVFTEIQSNHESLGWLLKIYYSMTVLGVIIGSWGFFLWYFRVQRYLDIILRNEAIKAENN